MFKINYINKNFYIVYYYEKILEIRNIYILY